MATGSNNDLHAHLIPNLEGLDQRIEKGRGAFGAVFEVKHNGVPCIAKGLHQILLGMGGYERVGGKEVETIRAKFLQECSLLSKLKHPNIVQFLGIHRTKEGVLLVMEYMHMDLAKCLDTHPDIPLPLKLSILLDVSCGLQHLHSQTPPIIHRDLTAANVLLTEGLRAKIADLGVSKILDIQQIQRAAHTAAPGTQAYMPPEALSPTPQYGTKLDVFSFGVLSLYTANQEFPTVHEPPMTTAIIRNKEVQIFKRKHWIDKMGVDHPLYHLAVQCLQDHPDQRPSAKELSNRLSGLCTQHPMKWKTILEAAMFNEDFVSERKDRENLHARLLRKEEELARKEKELQSTRQRFEEELQTKNQQVWQYKRQVDAVKADLDKCQESITALYNAAKKYAEEKEALQTEMEIYRTQAAMFNEDFVSERKDRENLHARLLQKEEELATKENELQSTRQRFEEELKTKNQQVWQYKRQMDEVTTDLDKCQMELNQYKVPTAEFHNGQRSRYRYEEDRSRSFVDPLQNESERPLHTRAAQPNTPIKRKKKKAVTHDMISPSIPSSSPSGQTQGYRATVQGAPLLRDHMTQPPHPPPDLHSSHTTVQRRRPRGSQSSFTTLHHNAGGSHYGEEPLKRSASFSSLKMLNDFESNRTSY